MNLLGPVTIRWRPIVFCTALFWFWYLVPAALESRAAHRVILLLQP
jgi:hypothetical protein